MTAFNAVNSKLTAGTACAHQFPVTHRTIVFIALLTAVVLAGRATFHIVALVPPQIGTTATTLATPFARPALSCPPYRIFSDDTPEVTAHLAQLLQDTRAEFLAVFGSNMPPCAPEPPVDVYWFACEKQFRAYATRIASHLVQSAGFFWHDRNQLVLVNQQGTERYRRFLSLPSLPITPTGTAPAASGFDASWQRTVAAAAANANDRLIRHEAAHQLFQQFGWLSPARSEPTWLTEGLAQYCETQPIGAWHPTLADRLRHFRDTAQLLPLVELLNHREPTGFLEHLPSQTEIAYAQSWAIVWWLMQPPRRDLFLTFVKTLASHDALHSQDMPSLLSTALGHTCAQLHTEWNEWVNQL